MKIVIRQAQIDNCVAITKLTLELGYLVTEENIKEWLDYLLKSENHMVLLAQDECGQTCGWIVMEKRISLEAGFKAEITGLVVGTEWRRLGIGKELVAAAESWAIESGLSRIVVRSNIKRKESHVFYNNIGFSLVKSAHNYEKQL